MTKILDFTKEINIEEIKEAADAIRNGELVIFPTETVYGIGADASNSKAVDEIFVQKG